MFSYLFCVIHIIFLHKFSEGSHAFEYELGSCILSRLYTTLFLVEGLFSFAGVNISTKIWNSFLPEEKPLFLAMKYLISFMPYLRRWKTQFLINNVHFTVNCVYNATTPIVYNVFFQWHCCCNCHYLTKVCWKSGFFFFDFLKCVQHPKNLFPRNSQLETLPSPLGAQK